MLLPCYSLGGLVVDALVAEDVGMAPNHLVANRRHDGVEIEGPVFLGYARVEDDLQQQIAELVTEAVDIAALNRIVDFVGFLDGVRRDGGEGFVGRPTDTRSPGRAAAP